MHQSLTQKVTPRDHIQGAAGAPLELVEYGDYQCSHCGLAYIELKKIKESLGVDLKFVFRNFPLIEIHPDAMNAAIAAEAAGKQEKFWEMHDLLLENQENLAVNDLFAYAGQIGLDRFGFEQDLNRAEITGRIKEDMESGLQSGVTGTPTFYVNGRKYGGEWLAEPFIAFLKVELERLRT